MAVTHPHLPTPGRQRRAHLLVKEHRVFAGFLRKHPLGESGNKDDTERPAARLVRAADEDRAIETAGRLANLVAGDDFLFDGHPVPLSVAIGLTVIERGDTPTAVLARADQAMYRVKVAA